jgi:hypothetical protein
MSADFSRGIESLVAQMDPVVHSAEIRRLRGCRSIRDLDDIAAAQGGWLSPHPQDPKLRLVKHGLQTFLVVKYEDGWTSRVGMQDFQRPR